MIKLTVEKAQQILLRKTSDELFELSMSLEIKGQTELAEKVLDLACKKQDTEFKERESAEDILRADDLAYQAWLEQEAEEFRKPEPAAPSDDSQAYQAWLEAHAPSEPAPIDELADVPVELVKFSDFAHLSKQELVRMVKHLGLTVPPMPTRKELAQLLADAENGVQRPNALEPAEPKPEPTKPYQSAYAFEPADQYVPKQPEPLTYRELQASAKELGVKASGSYATIEARIERHLSGTAAEADYTKPKAKSTKPKAKAEPKPKAKAAKADTSGLTYRQAQRFNSWCKENITGYCPPCKNSGWVNVRLLMVGWLNSHHFKQVMAQKKQVAELAAHLEVEAKELFSLLQATATLGQAHASTHPTVDKGVCKPGTTRAIQICSWQTNCCNRAIMLSLSRLS